MLPANHAIPGGGTAEWFIHGTTFPTSRNGEHRKSRRVHFYTWVHGKHLSIASLAVQQGLFFWFRSGRGAGKSVFFANSDILLIVDHPSELDHGEVRGKREASPYGRLISGRVER